MITNLRNRLSPSVWTPADDRCPSDAALVFDPEDASNVLDGNGNPCGFLGRVHTLKDVSGNGNDAVQNTLSLRPRYLDHAGGRDNDYLACLGFTTVSTNFPSMTWMNIVNLSVEVDFALASWTGDLQYVFARYTGTSQWALAVSGGVVMFRRTTNGSTFIDYPCPRSLAGLPPMARVKFRVSFTLNESGLSVARFWLYEDGRWAYVGMSTNSNTTTTHTGNGLLYMGSRYETSPMTGRIHRLRLWSDPGFSTPVFDLNPSAEAHGSGRFQNRVDGQWCTVEGTDGASYINLPVVKGGCLQFSAQHSMPLSRPVTFPSGMAAVAAVTATQAVGTVLEGVGNTPVFWTAHSSVYNCPAISALAADTAALVTGAEQRGIGSVLRWTADPDMGTIAFSRNGGGELRDSYNVVASMGSILGAVSLNGGVLGRLGVWRRALKGDDALLAERWAGSRSGFPIGNVVPSDLGRVAVWLDPAARIWSDTGGTTPAADGVSARRWDGAPSPGSAAPSMRESTNGPVFDAGDTDSGGSPYLTFAATSKLAANATKDYLVSALSDISSDYFTFALAFKPSAAQVSSAEVLNMEHAASKGASILQDGTSLNRYALKYGASTAYADCAPGKWQSLVFHKRGTSIFVYRNGRRTGQTFTVTDAVANAAATLTLGDFTGGGSGFQGQIGDVAVFDPAVDPGSVCGWLNRKYGINPETPVLGRASLWLDSRVMTKASASAYSAPAGDVVSWIDRASSIPFDQGGSKGILEAGGGVSFNGSRHLRTATGVRYRNGPALTVFILFNATPDAPGTNLYRCVAGEGSSGSFRNWWFDLYNSTLSFGRRLSSRTGLTVTSGWTLAVGRWNGSSCEMRIHSSGVASDRVSSAAMSSSDGLSDSFVVGAKRLSGSVSEYFTGTVHQVVQFESVLSSDEEDEVAEYLAALVGLSWVPNSSAADPVRVREKTAAGVAVTAVLHVKEVESVILSEETQAEISVPSVVHENIVEDTVLSEETECGIAAVSINYYT